MGAAEANADESGNCTRRCLNSTFCVCFNAFQVGMTKKLTAFCIMVLEIYSESAQW